MINDEEKKKTDYDTLERSVDRKTETLDMEMFQKVMSDIDGLIRRYLFYLGLFVVFDFDSSLCSYIEGWAFRLPVAGNY